MLKGGDDKWRTMANEKLYRSKMLIGALYRGELAGELRQLGYGIEKTHADGRFEIEGVSRDAIEAFSTRRAAIVAAMEERGLGGPDTNPRQRFLARNAGVGEGRLTRKGARDMGKVPARGAVRCAADCARAHRRVAFGGRGMAQGTSPGQVTGRQWKAGRRRRNSALRAYRDKQGLSRAGTNPPFAL